MAWSGVPYVTGEVNFRTWAWVIEVSYVEEKKSR